ncbi:UvrD-helicase domain-containing protein [Pseudomonas pseudonitroreducens]|uniref:UvrD-helicase domain-containing protein n=1 Tax=Pseudomonas pseudonitroreducens TaxID=2892326 RepID=UPI001F44361E|nr:UvrD-helicase domain-containing protein [Pseudomonas pseudonitroreducens]
MNSVEFISAGAGSGKTYKLTATLSDALESGAARPDAILATTFTIKAAKELRERARSWLLGKGRIDLATAVGQAKIGTVNSVCGRLLQRFCFELGLSPDQTVLSDGQVKRLLATSLSETLDREGQAELVRLTARLGIEHDKWSRFIESMVKAARDNDISPERLRPMGEKNSDLMLSNWPAPSAPATATEILSSSLTKAVMDVSAFIQQTQASGGAVAQNLQKGLLELERLERIFRDGRWAWPDWIAAGNIDAGAKVRDLLVPVVEAAQMHESHPVFHSDVRRYLDLVFNLAADALETYAEAKRMLGAVDFGDQEALLLRAVRENPDVRDALASELDLVMVDEFQDTSPMQLALFVEFAKLAKRSVWVGDPKQAIYGFRGTDARLIAGVLDAIKGWGGSIGEPLTISRRSVPGLVSLSNAVFEQAFLPELSADAIVLQAHRGEIPDQPVLFNWEFESSKNETDYLGMGPAVRELIDSGLKVEDKAARQVRDVEPGDIAVLCRTNDQVELAVTSLIRWGIPSASPRAGLLGTPEAILTLACLRRLLNAGDTVASALVLTLVDGMPIQAWLADRLEFLAEDDARPQQWKAIGDSAHPLLSRLEALRPCVEVLTPREALRLVVAESHAARVASQWSGSPQEARSRIANLEALLDLASTYEDECVSAKRPATVSGLLQWFDAMAASEDDNRATTVDNAVSVMTHHGAKGLEWPVVVLTSLGTEARSALWEVRSRTEGKFDPERPLDNRFVHFWPKTWGNRRQPQAAVNAEAGTMGQAMAADALAENKRLLYVSMTRARDANVLVSCRRRSGPNLGWVNEVGAGALLFGDSGTLTLADGRKIVRESRAWAAAACAIDPPTQAAATCSWFVADAVLEPKPLWFRPSSAAGGAYAAVQSESVGARIAISASVEMSLLGSALHLCIAQAGVTGRVAETAVEHILQTWGVAHAVNRSAVVEQVRAFYEWVRSRWPNGRVRVEVPIEASRLDGTRLRGRIDLLVDTPSGWILVDHKSNPGSQARDEVLVQDYGPQLSAYAEAVQACTGKMVLEQWLYFPVAARLTRVVAKA